MTVYGYMRISTTKEEQKFDRQEAQLADKVDVLFKDRISGSKRVRPELDKMLNQLKEGDVVYILEIERLARSTRDLLEIVDVIKEKGAALKSVKDTWLDTTSENPMSDFLLVVMGAMAEMDRKQIVKRVNEGLTVAKSKGVKLGRPKTKKSKVDVALKLLDEGGYTKKEIAEIAGISRKTLYNIINEREAKKYGEGNTDRDS